MRPRRTIRSAVPAILKGELAAATWLQECLERIDERETVVGAWQMLAREQALQAARAADSKGARGALAGVPFGVKDVLDTQGLPTTYGSLAYAGHQPARDAACVARLTSLGAICAGKTVTTEFAGAAQGKTRNPFDPSRTPGGSSSGSAAAVAAGMIPLALGTQTAGSLIRPASFCGVVAFKPSLGSVDTAGLKPLAPSLDTIGWMTADVGDAAFVYERWFEDAPRVAAHAMAAPRIGVCRTPRWERASADMQLALERTATALARAGAHVSDFDLPPRLHGLYACHDRVFGWEMRESLAHDLRAHLQQLHPRTLAMVEARGHVTRQDYDAARADAVRLRAAFHDAMRGFDALLTLPACGEAPLKPEGTGDPVFNSIWTLLGAPCVSLPCGTGAAGLPLGVQVIGSFGSDKAALAAALFVESALAEA